MKAKTLIERNLKFSGKYIYMGITRGSVESGQMSCCDNCGKLITNIVSVTEYQTNKHYHIGTDCAETLSSAKCLYNDKRTDTDFYMDIYAYNQAARFVTELNAGCELRKDSFYCRLTNRKGKEVEIFTHILSQFFPEYIK